MLLIVFILAGCKKEEVEDLIIENNLVIVRNNNFILWDEVEGASYELKINDEVEYTKDTYYYIESFPVTVQIKINTKNYNTDFTEPVTFDIKDDLIKEALFTYHKEEDANLYLDLYNDETHFLFDSENKEVLKDFDLINNMRLTFTNTIIDNLDTNEKYYLVSKSDFYEISFNIIEVKKPHVISNYLYTNFESDLVFELHLEGATLKVSEDKLAQSAYTINGNQLIIKKEALKEIFENDNRDSLIIGLTFNLGDSYYLDLINIIKY